MRILKLLSVAVLAFGSVHPAQAADQYGFDQLHTQVMFFVSHLGFAKSSGEFHQVDGYFMFDEANPAASVIDVSIPTSSIDMDSEKWNTHMKGKNFFNVEEFPVMTFKSTAIAVTGEKTADITGDFTLLGVTKPVVLNVVHNKTGNNPFSGKAQAGFSATTQIKRSDFGMKYALPGVGDDVEIRLEVEAVKSEVDPTNAGNQ